MNVNVFRNVLINAAKRWSVRFRVEVCGGLLDIQAGSSAGGAIAFGIGPARWNSTARPRWGPQSAVLPWAMPDTATLRASNVLTA